MTSDAIQPAPKSPFGRWGSYVITSGDTLALARSAFQAGARVLQYRDKTAKQCHKLTVAKQIRDISAEYRALFIVNDHLDIALLVDAGGVHLGQDDIPISEARRLTPDGFIIGVSTHSIDQARKAEDDGADYIGIGPVFGTPTKPDYTPIGLEAVRAVMQSVKIPVVAIGGIDLDNVDMLRDVGVTNVAMVRGFARDTEESVRRVNQTLLGDSSHG